MNFVSPLTVVLIAYVMWRVWRQSRSLTARLILSSILVYLGFSIVFVRLGG